MSGNQRDDLNDADTPISPVRIGDAAIASEPATGDASSTLSRSLIVAASIVLFFVVLSVVFVLPKFIEPGLSSNVQSTEQPTHAPVENPTSNSTTKLNDEKFSVGSRRASQELLGDVLKLVKSLAQRNVKEWAEDEFAAAREEIALGEKSYREQRYSKAEEIYQRAYDELRSIDGRAAQVISKAVADGFEHIVESNSHAAQKSFHFALSVSPDHDAAANGLRRSKTLDQVLALVHEANGYEEIGELDGALARYDEARSLDGETPGVANSIARVKQTLLDNEYRDLMSQGITAFDNGKNVVARKSFVNALKIKPHGIEASDALAQVKNKILAQQITQHLRSAMDAEQSENWSKAGVQYRSVAKLDPELDGAKSGALRADRRATLDRQLISIIGKPARLADDNVHREAAAVLARAQTITNKGTRLANQITQLSNVIKVARTPIPVTLLSNELSDITLYKIGPLGLFTQRSISVLPGHYVVVGRRRGFRDTRVEFDVSPDRPGVEITVQCEQKLAFGDLAK